MSFTPGPWNIVTADWRPWPDAVEINAHNEVICFTGGHDAERQKDNARLIASAPEMLEALKEIKELLRFALLSTTADIAKDAKPYLDKADAALAKAEGRT